MTFICHKKTADSHDAGLESAGSHFFDTGSFADARDVGLKVGKWNTCAGFHLVMLACQGRGVECFGQRRGG